MTYRAKNDGWNYIKLHVLNFADVLYNLKVRF